MWRERERDVGEGEHIMPCAKNLFSLAICRNYGLCIWGIICFDLFKWFCRHVDYVELVFGLFRLVHDVQDLLDVVKNQGMW